MAKDTSPQCKQCRRESEKLFLKGERCLTDKCAVERRTYPPGEHGRGRIKQSEYLLQLREKQKARRYYQVLEKQFHHYYVMASRKDGITGGSSCSRCASTTSCTASASAPRAVQARSARAARSLTVNGKKVDIPSYPGPPGRRGSDPRQQQGL